MTFLIYFFLLIDANREIVNIMLKINKGSIYLLILFYFVKFYYSFMIRYDYGKNIFFFMKVFNKS